MRKLSKRNVEALLSDYDSDPIAALHAALRILIPDCPATWPDAVSKLSCDEKLKESLTTGDIRALDALVKQFVETRSL